MRWFLLVCLFAAPLLAEDGPEEIAAMLLSPREAYRNRGRALLEREKTPAKVLDLLVRWARQPRAYADDVARRAVDAEGADKERLERIARYLEDPRAAEIGIDVYLLSVPHAVAAKVLGDERQTIVGRDGWKSWWRAIARVEGDVVSWRSFPGRDGAALRHRAIHQLAFIQDIEVEQGNGVFLADPIVGILKTRTVYRLRPVLSRDRKFVTIRFAIDMLDVRRPIPVVDKKLPVGSGKIQKPEIVENAVRRTVTLPMGGHAAWRVRRDQKRTVLLIARAVRGAPAAMAPPERKPAAPAVGGVRNPK